MHAELQKILEEDQKDRETGMAMDEVRERDKERRARTRDIIETEIALSPEDYFHAAIIFQHGDTEKDYEKAIALAQKSMDAGYRPARRLYASAIDRLLVAQGQRQKFGTQWQTDASGEARLLPLDPHTSDEERAYYDVPPRREDI